ncbi:hypothetical protein [Elioraea rosea]|uniref:hypothetical protein n=1 Tax=Elioraea rosea TaxID=2492390 RepID=UPI001183902F|nr:hypothetical protein [Elioraea rosea]
MRVLAAAFLLAALPASAQTLRDGASGLAITAPQGYAATASPPSDPAAPGRAVFDIRRPGESDTGCRIAVNAAPANALLSQEQLNLRVAAPQYQQAMIGQLSQVYQLLSVSPVLQGNVIGLAVIGDFLPRPGMPERAMDVRTLLIFFDTPIQRVTFTCIAEREEFQNRLPEFEAVARGLEMP